MVDVSDWMCEHWLRAFSIYFGDRINLFASEYMTPQTRYVPDNREEWQNWRKKNTHFPQRNENATRNGNNMYLKLWPPTYSRRNSEYQRFYNTIDHHQQPWALNDGTDIKNYSFRTWFNNYSLSVRSTPTSTIDVHLPNIFTTFSFTLRMIIFFKSK